MMRKSRPFVFGLAVLLSSLSFSVEVNANEMIHETSLHGSKMKVLELQPTQKFIEVGTISLKLDVFNMDGSEVDLNTIGFKCESDLKYEIKDKSIFITVPINDSLDGSIYAKTGYGINYFDFNETYFTQENKLSFDLNDYKIFKFGGAIQQTRAYTSLEVTDGFENYDFIKRLELDNLNFEFNQDYIVKISNANVFTQYANDEKADFNVIISRMEQNIINQDLECAVIKNIGDVFTDGTFCNPIDEENVLEVNRDNTQLNKCLDITCNQYTDLYSIDDNGVLFFYNNDIAIVKYEKYDVIYKNIMITNTNETYLEGDVIGVTTQDNFQMYLVQNETFLNTNYFYSDYGYSRIGKIIPRYFQAKSEWSGDAYASSTIASSGCGPSSFAMVLSSIRGIEYTTNLVVKDMYDYKDGYNWYYSPGEGSYHSIFEALCEMYGLNIEDHISVSKKSLIETLNQNKFVIICINNGPIYTGDGHFITLYGTEDDKFYISDSASCFSQDKLYSYKDLGNITSAVAIWEQENDTE